MDEVVRKEILCYQQLKNMGEGSKPRKIRTKTKFQWGQKYKKIHILKILEKITNGRNSINAIQHS